MVLYNITGSANTTGYLDFVQTVHTNILSSSLGIILLIIIFVIALISFFAGGFEAKRSMIGASFIVFILSMILRVAELASSTEVIFTAILLGAVLGWSMIKI